MFKKYFLIFNLLIPVILLSMDNESKSSNENNLSIPRFKKVKVPSTIGVEEVIDMEQKECFTQKTFKELFNIQQNYKRSLILARIIFELKENKSCQEVQGVNYVHAHNWNRTSKCVPPKAKFFDFEKFSPGNLKQKSKISYYELKDINSDFEYLCTQDDFDNFEYFNGKIYNICCKNFIDPTLHFELAIRHALMNNKDLFNEYFSLAQEEECDMNKCFESLSYDAVRYWDRNNSYDYWFGHLPNQFKKFNFGKKNYCKAKKLFQIISDPKINKFNKRIKNLSLLYLIQMDLKEINNFEYHEKQIEEILNDNEDLVVELHSKVVLAFLFNKKGELQKAKDLLLEIINNPESKKFYKSCFDDFKENLKLIDSKIKKKNGGGFLKKFLKSNSDDYEKFEDKI